VAIERLVHDAWNENPIELYGPLLGLVGVAYTLFNGLVWGAIFGDAWNCKRCWTDQGMRQSSETLA
jgi:hypothetical protein